MAEICSGNSSRESCEMVVRHDEVLKRLVPYIESIDGKMDGVLQWMTSVKSTGRAFLIVGLVAGGLLGGSVGAAISNISSSLVGAQPLQLPQQGAQASHGK